MGNETGIVFGMLIRSDKAYLLRRRRRGEELLDRRLRWSLKHTCPIKGVSEGEETGKRSKKLIIIRQDQLETKAFTWMPSRTLFVIDY